MDIGGIRLGNLKYLVKSLQGAALSRRQRDIALDLDISASYLSQLLGGKKMGDDVARKLEAVRNLPRGWMDQRQWPENGIKESAAPAYTAPLVIGISPQLLAAAHQLVRRAGEALALQFNPETEDGAAEILIGCGYLKGRKEWTVTLDNLVEFTKLMRTRRMGLEA